MITTTATMAKKLYPILEQEDKTLAEVAREALDKAFEIYEERAKFAVILQAHTVGGKSLRPGAPGARSGVLGLYSTRNQADNDAHSAVIRKVQQDVGTAWVVPILYQKPGEFWTAAHEAIEDIEPEAGQETPAERRLRELLASPGFKPSERRCPHLFRTSDQAVQSCVLSEGHAGPCEAAIPEVGDAPLDNPRRLIGLPPVGDDPEEEDDDELV